ncbi:MAG: hypothetical protein ACKKL4_03145 [Patescibacteria group bacterium]
MYLGNSSQIQSTIIGKLSWAGALLAIAILTLYGMRYFISGPEIINLGASYRVAESARYELSFKVANTNRLMINGNEVVAQAGGEVGYVLYLARGMNIIQIDAFDPYGNHKQLYLYITYPQ